MTKIFSTVLTSSGVCATLSLVASSLVAIAIPAVAAPPTGTRDLVIAATGIFDDISGSSAENVDVLSATLNYSANAGGIDEVSDSIVATVTTNGDVLFEEIPIYTTAEYSVTWEIDDPAGAYPLFDESQTGGGFTSTDITAIPATYVVERSYLSAGTKSISGTVFSLGTDSTMGGSKLSVTATATFAGSSYIRDELVTASGSGTYSVSGIRAPATVALSFNPVNQSDISGFNDSEAYGPVEERFAVRSARTSYLVDMYIPDPAPAEEPVGTARWSGYFVDGSAQTVLGTIRVFGEDASQVGGCEPGESPCTVLNLEVGDYYAVFDDGASQVAVVDFTVATEGQVITSESHTVLNLPAASASVDVRIFATIDNRRVDVTDRLGQYGARIALTGLVADLDPRIETVVSNRFEPLYTVTGAGALRFENLWPGEYRFSAHMDATTEFRVAVVESEEITIGTGTNTATVDTQYFSRKGDALVVKVRDSVSREPVDGAVCTASVPMSIQGMYGGLGPATAETDSKGVATFGGLLRGITYGVSCVNEDDDRSGFAVIPRGITLQQGRNNASIAMEYAESASILIGRVIDENGDPVPGIRVSSRVDYEFANAPGVPFTQEISDFTDSNGLYVMDGVISGKTATVRAKDRTGLLGDTTIRIQQLGFGTTVVNDIEMLPGVPVSGTVGDGEGNDVDAYVTISSPTTGFEMFGQTNARGAVVFDALIGPGDYIVNVVPFGTDSDLLSGWLGSAGAIHLSPDNARTFVVTSSSTELALGEIELAPGGSISGTIEFTDSDGSALDSWVNFGYAYLYSQSDTDEWVRVEPVGLNARVGYAAWWSEGDYSIGGLPAGTYRVCFGDNEGNGGTYNASCFGGSTVDNATSIAVAEGQDVDGTDGTLSYAAPIDAPRTVDFDPADFADMEGNVSLVASGKRNSAVGLDPDLAGQWVSVQTVTTSSRQSRTTTASEWKPVGSDAKLVIKTPKAKKGKRITVVVVDSANEIVGWVAGAKPTAPVKPVINGDIAIGSWVTATEGSWTGGGAITTRWYLCAKKAKSGSSLSSKAKCRTTGSAGANELQLSTSMRRKYLVFGVTSTNAFGSSRYFVSKPTRIG